MEINYFHPVIGDFLDSLDKATKAKVRRLVRLLMLEEYHLSMPFSKKLAANLYELRAQGEVDIRIFYTFHNNKIVLLNAIRKKSQKINKHDLELAKQRFLYLKSR